MTAAEQAALDEAKAILSLHFDAFVLTTRAADEDDTCRINSDWHGHLADVMGLNRVTGLRLDRIAIEQSGGAAIS